MVFFLEYEKTLGNFFWKRKRVHDECKDNGASMTGDVTYRKKPSRGQFFRFMSEQSPALVVMEACGSAHYWARELVKLGHAVKLIAP
jgi:transposase